MGYRLVPDAEIFYAMDKSWWAVNGMDAIRTLSQQCEVWTGQPDWSEKWGFNLLTWDQGQGYSPKVGQVHGNKLSCIQLINIVAWEKPSLIVLLGYDNQGKHWHPEYTESGLTGILPAGSDDYAVMAQTCPIRIVNASRHTAIEGIERVRLEDIPQTIGQA